MVSYRSLLLFVTAVSALPSHGWRRQTNSGNQESLDTVGMFSVINYDWQNTLAPWAQQWNGTLLEILKFDRGLDIATINKILMDAVANNLNDAYAENSLAATDSETTLTQLRDSLEPEIAIIAKGLAAPKAKFEADVLSIVKWTMSSLASVSKKYVDSLVRIVDASHKAALKAVSDKIANDWAAALATLD